MKQYLEDLTFTICIMLAVAAMVWGFLKLRDFLEPLPKLHQKSVITIPLEEINKCHDKNGVIIARKGAWECIGAKP